MLGSSYRDVLPPPVRRDGLTVTAALCWWNERPEDLRACVGGVAGIADRIVALDGAYRRYPDATPASHRSQAQAIRRAAHDAGMECLVVTPDRLWAGQVEKRTYLLNLAVVDSDWIVTVDTDHIVQTTRETARAALAALSPEMDVLDVQFHTPENPERPIEQSASGNWHISQAGSTVPIPQIYRALPGFRVEQRHWWYSAVKAGRRVWVWGGPDNDGVPKLPHYPFGGSFYRVEHRCLYRTKEQVLAGRAFCNDRDGIVERTGQEDDRADLPPPRFDFVRMPA